MYSDYPRNSAAEHPLPFPRLQGRGNKARENRLRLHPPPRAGGGGKGELLNGKWKREPAHTLSACLESLPAYRFKIPLEMAQATPAL